uniref:Uncharacterized protein n=1 Tax=Rhizophora mucronata TaxID=61149 RepID=A0A2P2QMM6_RHIMU
MQRVNNRSSLFNSATISGPLSSTQLLPAYTLATGKLPCLRIR